MKKLLILLLFVLLVIPVKAQEDIFLPIIFKGNDMAIDPKLIITDGDIEIDLLQGGWKLADPYWNPQISQYKAGGTFVNSQLAEGRRMVYQEYDNVIETIPLSLRGNDQAQAMKTAHDALALLRQAGDYWTKPYEYDQVWIEVKLPCNACLAGYSRIIKGTIPELTNPYGQPSFSPYNESVMEGITLTIERDPFWQITKPDEIIGPLYNLIDNPDFELWNFGIVDSQPDSWTDIETTHIAGQNSRSQDFYKFGQSSLKVRVSGSTLTGAAKGVTQVINDTKDETEYTIIAWVRSEGVSNGVGRILINYASQLELYRSGDSHGWTLYTGKITTGSSDVVSINCQILTTAANTDGTIYIDGLMFIEGDWEQEAIDNVLPYLSGSHIVNHQDDLESGSAQAGDINYLDVWHIPGNIDSLIKLQVQNNSLLEETGFSKLRIGMRRTGDIFNFDNYADFEGVTDTTASSDNRQNLTALNQEWKSVASKIISSPEKVLNNMGRFRAFARVYDTGNVTLEVRIRYFVGSATVTKTLTGKAVSVNNTWTIVDLTEDRSINQDLKMSPEQIGQLGYIVEARQVTGSSEAYLDYVIIMPTDGGFVEAEFTDVIPFGGLVSIDNTGMNNYVSVIGSGNGQWVKLFDVNGVTGIFDIAEYNGEVYFTSPGSVYRIKNVNQYEQLFSVPVISNVMTTRLAVYNGKLIMGTHRSGPPHKLELYSTVDGVSWSLEKEIVASSGRPEDLVVFKGKLYILEYTGADVRIYSYDGSTVTNVYTSVSGTDEASTFAILQNKLYTTSNNNLIVLNDAETAFVTVLALGFNTHSLKTFQDAIYMKDYTGGPASDFAYVFNGQTVTQAGSQLPTGHVADFFAQESYNNKLFAGGTVSGASVSNIISTSNGENWLNHTLSSFSIISLRNINGSLYAGSFDNISTNVSIYTFTEQEFPPVVFNANFSGTFFRAPSRTKTNSKRHRYFFSYDRNDFINNIDDKALIGIGFVPRYLELPMKEN